MTNSYKRTLQYFKPYIFKIILSAIFMLIVAGATATAAWLIKPVLDDIFISKKTNMLKLLPFAIIALYFIKGVFEFLHNYILRTLGQEIIMKIRNDLYEKHLSLSVKFFSDNSTGALMSRITNDVLVMQQALPATIEIIKQVATIIGLSAVAFSQDFTLAFIAIFVFPLSVYPIITFSKKLRKFSKKGQEKIGDLSTILHETFTGIRIVKAFVMEDYEKARFAQENHKLFGIFKRIIKIDTLSPPLMEFIGSIGVSAVIFYGGYHVINGGYSSGTFFSFLTALIMMYQPIKRINTVNNQIQQAISASARVFEILDIEPDIVDKKGALDKFSFKDNVEFKNVCFEYAKDKQVLSGLNFSVKKGEVAAFVGSSGSGKTTLVNLLPRFYDLTEGAIMIDGVDIKDVKLNALRENIGIVTQDTFLFNDTVRNNIAYGKGELSDDAVKSAAKAANAHDFIMKFPEGYNTIIGERGVKISGGQRQRLAIARAILKNPPILILDEATSSLDTESEFLVQQALMNLIKDRTTFVIAHRLSTIHHADRIYVIDGGRIVESGKHAELLANSRIYRKLYDMQFK